MKMQKSLSASEQLRQQYQQTLEQHLKRLKRSLESGPGQRFWLKWYQSLDEQPAERQQAARLSWAQLVHLPLYLESWLGFALRSEAELNAYLKVIAADQPPAEAWKRLERTLAALSLMLERVEWHLKRWQKQLPGTVMNDPVFVGLAKVPWEEQLRLETDRIDWVAPIFKRSNSRAKRK